MNVRLIAAGALAASILGSVAQAAPLVTNGDFNSSVYTSNTTFGTGWSQANQQGVTGWTGNNGYDLFFTSAANASVQNAAGPYSYTGKELLWGPIANSPSGGSFIALDGEQTNGIQGGISQMISGLIAGTQYELSFDWAAGQLQSRTGDTTEQLQVSLGGEAHSTAILSNPSKSFSGWKHAVIDYTATSTSELLNFLSVGTPLGLPPIALLDGVSLVAVPEPVSLAVLGIGVIGLTAVRRRRKA